MNNHIFPNFSFFVFKQNILLLSVVIFIVIAAIILIQKWINYVKEIKPKIEEFNLKFEEFKKLISLQDYTRQEKEILINLASEINDMTNPLELIISTECFDIFSNDYIAQLTTKDLAFEEKGRIVKNIYNLRQKLFV